ncbi:alpha/beta fold hydrolase [Rothia terrae]|uniref:alpha/beta fold hydrolase n=1 Tax=Rothia terrae TaxID=396015 RepID=UPI001D15C694|nr:alpha/beta hydrolase [Rothia terrae]MDT0188824.1 alpha/beta hydrolase [Rothia terrae]
MTPPFENVPDTILRGAEHSAVVLGTQTHYWIYGDTCNPLVVLVHGFRGDHHGLALIGQYLSDDFCVIIPDLPGFGRTSSVSDAQHNLSTYAAWLNAFVETVIEDSVVLVGHSFGSIVSTYAAVVRPENFTRVSLINPISEPALEGSQKLVSRLASAYYSVGTKLPEKLGFLWLTSKIVTRASSEFMMRTTSPELRAFINGQHDAYFGAFSSRQTLLDAYETSISETAAYYAPALQTPTQMIVAEDDDLGTLKTATAMRDSIATVRMDVIEQVGHLVHYETPRHAAQLIKEFIED